MLCHRIYEATRFQCTCSSHSAWCDLMVDQYSTRLLHLRYLKKNILRPTFGNRRLLPRAKTTFKDIEANGSFYIIHNICVSVMLVGGITI